MTVTSATGCKDRTCTSKFPPSPSNSANMSDANETYHCPYCKFKTAVPRRLSSHVSQSAKCRNQIVADNQPNNRPGTKRAYSPELPENGADPNNNPEPITLEPTPASMGQRPSKQARVEDDEPEDESPFETGVYSDEFHPPAGQPCGSSIHHQFDDLSASQRTAGCQPWEPFSSTDDWELARWIVTAGLSQKQTNDILSLNLVSTLTRIELI